MGISKYMYSPNTLKSKQLDFQHHVFDTQLFLTTSNRIFSGYVRFDASESSNILFGTEFESECGDIYVLTYHESYTVYC